MREAVALGQVMGRTIEQGLEYASALFIAGKYADREGCVAMGEWERLAGDYLVFLSFSRGPHRFSNYEVGGRSMCLRVRQGREVLRGGVGHSSCQLLYVFRTIRP